MSNRLKREFLLTVLDLKPDPDISMHDSFRVVTDAFEDRCKNCKIEQFFILTATELGVAETYKVYILLSENLDAVNSQYFTTSTYKGNQCFT